MLDIRLVRERRDFLQKMLERRGSDLSFAPILELDERRRRMLREVESLKHERKVVSDDIAQMKRQGKDAADTIARMREVSQRIKDLDNQLGEVDIELQRALLLIPNVPHESVPFGKSLDDNPVVKRWGDRRGAGHPRLRAGCQDDRGSVHPLLGNGSHVGASAHRFHA
jgi:seryl-tRNA synthetase